MNIRKLKQWINVATTDELAALAKLAKTTPFYLKYNLATGLRKADAPLAARLEHAATIVRANNPHLPVLLRTDLCPACSVCAYAKACTK
jgi:hypothetical protein